MCTQVEGKQAPCGSCTSCKAWQRDEPLNFYAINSGIDGTVEDVRYLLENSFYRAPTYARVHVAFFDEAHRLSLAARDAFLVPMEAEELSRVVLVFSLIDPEIFSPQFRNRCRVFRLEAPSLAEKIEFLSRIVAAEQLNCDFAAIELLARCVASFRQLANQLEAIAEEVGGGAIDIKTVRSFLARGGVADILRYLKAVTSSDFDGQKKALADARMTEPEKAQAILGILMFLKLRFVGPTHASPEESDYALLLDDAECVEIVEKLNQRAEWLGISLEDLFDRLLQFWSFTPHPLNLTTFSAHVIRFNDLMTAVDNGTYDFGQRRRTIQERPRAPRTERRRFHLPQSVRSAARAGEYLSAAQVSEIYEASTFLLQRYGLAFNARIEVQHHQFGIDDEPAAKELVSELLRELGQNFHRWLPVPSSGEDENALHRIALHERLDGEGLVSSIILHVPERLHLEVGAWLQNNFASRFIEGVERNTAIDFDFEHHRKEQGRGPRHWELVRSLWRGMDPYVQLGSEPVIDVLKVPPRLRRPAGQIEMRRFAISQSLSLASRRSEANDYMPHLSAFEDRAWNWLYRCWEFAAHEERIHEMKARAKFLEQTEAELADARDSLTKETMDALRAKKLIEWKKASEKRQKPWNSGKQDTSGIVIVSDKKIDI